ncbi:response regulator [Deinococcus sp. Marseille-Q6407]|uniref:response regulator n=1 Tax=Deinococcus sp. Marseille-Q6407 TaxID=2969223 RepID=UPI0021C1F9D9|nr:response regulator [Deinococcus sp. Marseille-Q6407]
MSHVFVIDDSISVRKALELALTKEGLQVRSAASAEQALDLLDNEPTDLIIADVIMPGMSGFELCQRLKADEAHRDIPLLIISGNVDSDIRQQAQDAGAAGVLKKPFRQEELLPAVQQALASLSAADTVVSPALAATPATDLPEATEPAAEPMVNPPAEAARPQQHSGVFSAMVKRAAQAPGALSAALIERDGTVLERHGDPLPDNIGQFARFYMGTADFLAGRVGESGAGQLDLELGSKRLTIRGLGDKLLVSLSRL